MSKLIALLAACVAALTLVACGSSAGTKNQTGTGEVAATADTASWNKGGEVKIPVPKPNSGNGVKIAFSGFGTDNSYNQAIFGAMQTEASKYGATVDAVGPPTYNPQAQAQIVCDLATQKKYEYLVLEAQDPIGIIPCLKRAISAGIKVVGAGFPIGPNQEETSQLQVPGMLAQVAENERKIGEGLGNLIVRSCEGQADCKVAIMWGPLAAPYVKIKREVTGEILGKHSNIDVVCEDEAAYTQEGGRSKTADCLQANPDLNVVGTDGGQPSKGVQLAVEAAGKETGEGKGQIQVVETYATAYGLEQVRNGGYASDYYVRPASIGRAATAIILASHAGEKFPVAVEQSELDGVPSELTPEVLKKYPNLKGQFVVE